MNSEELDAKFAKAIELWKSDEIQESAEIMMGLAEQGHLVSIRELFHIFLDQEDYELARSYLEFAENQEEPTILYLKARLIEERDGVEAAVESFHVAANSGHPGANLLIFEWAIEDRNIASATYCLNRLEKFQLDLSQMQDPVTIEALRDQLNQLHDELAKIIPVYFVLASGYWIRVRNEINARYEDEEVWLNFLEENGLSTEEFDRYENWWNSSLGAAVVNNIASQYTEAIIDFVPSDFEDVIQDYLENYANWDDFIREFSQCTLADMGTSSSSPSYFCEYAILNGLCNSVVGDPEIGEETIMELATQVESWFMDNFLEAQTILLSAYNEIIKIR